MEETYIALIITNFISLFLFLFSEQLGRSKCKASAVIDLIMCYGLNVENSV